MTMVWEKIVVTAKEFLTEKNINDCAELNQPITQAKIAQYDWETSFAASSIFCEIVWKLALSGTGTHSWQQLDRLFSPSPIATHANFRGSKSFRTGEVPELGAIAIWKRGNSWQGAMGLVHFVSDNKQDFDIIDGRALRGSDDGGFFTVAEQKGKKIGREFKSDKLNLLGFIYPPNIEIP